MAGGDPPPSCRPRGCGRRGEKQVRPLSLFPSRTARLSPLLSTAFITIQLVVVVVAAMKTADAVIWQQHGAGCQLQLPHDGGEQMRNTRNKPAAELQQVQVVEAAACESPQASSTILGNFNSSCSGNSGTSSSTRATDHEMSVDRSGTSNEEAGKDSKWSLERRSSPIVQRWVCVKISKYEVVVAARISYKQKLKPGICITISHVDVFLGLVASSSRISFRRRSCGTAPGGSSSAELHRSRRFIWDVHILKMSR